MKWETVILGDIAEFSNGVNFDKSAYKKGIKLIGVSNFGERFKPDYNDLDEITEDVVRKNDYLQNGDIVFVRSNGNKALVGRCMLIDNVPVPVTYSGFCIRCRINDIKSFDPVFFTYHFKSALFRKAMSGTAVGANIQNLSQGRMSTYTTKIPDIETQRRIASILSAYDDLIENNQKQIKLLEEAAQRLYKEWFVDLRFPGHENVKIVDGVPEGWKKEKLEDVITYEIGGGWGEEEITSDYEKEAFVIRGTDFYGLTHGDLLSIPFRYHKSSNLSSRKLQHGDIIFEVSGGSKTEGVARTVLITQSMIDNWNNSVMCASFCKLVRMDIKYSQFMFNHFIYLRRSGKTSEYDKKSASSIVNYRWKDFLSKEMVLLPCNSILDKYNSLAEAVYSKIVACSLQIEKAKQARDRLLPKLMSGELEV